MKALLYGKRFLFLLAWILSFTCCALHVDVSASNETESSHNDLYDSKFHLIDHESRDERIGDYDINANNEIAVAAGEYINIYDENGKFLYGYSVSAAGAYAIDFHTDGITLCLLRENELIRLNLDGSIVSVSSVAADDSAVSKMTANMRKATKAYADCEYRLNASLTKLIKVNSEGQELMIYETSPYRGIADFMFIAVLLLSVLIVSGNFVKRKRAAALQQGG